MIIVVLGMHKSGTTLISQILNNSGVIMGKFDESISYDSGNQYERKETLEINLDILGKGYNDFSLDVIEPVDHTDRVLNDRISELISSLEKEHMNWGFKDPRTCLTYNVWNQFLPEHKLIIVYRSPVEIWYHYTKNLRWWNFVGLLKRGVKALKAWFVHNSQISKIISLTPNEYIVLNYRDFMDGDNYFQAMESFVGINLVDSRQKNLYRAKGEETLLYKIAKKICSARFSMDVDSLYKALSRNKFIADSVLK